MVTALGQSPYEQSKQAIQAAREALDAFEERIDRYEIISRNTMSFSSQDWNERDRKLKLTYIACLSEATELLTHVRDALDVRFGTKWRESSPVWGGIS